MWRVPLLRDYINGFVLRDDAGRVTLIDMGLPGHGPKLLAALDWIGSSPGDVTRLLLTHAHPDHIGGAAHVAHETGLGMGIHEDDAGYVRTGTDAAPGGGGAARQAAPPGHARRWSSIRSRSPRSSSTASCCRSRAGCGWCTCRATPPATWASSTSRRGSW